MGCLDAGVCRAGWYFPPGEGIGLSHAQRLLIAMGGRLRVEDHDGTTVTIALPTAAPPREEVAERAAHRTVVP